jgi:RHS repeat-associated protein
VATAKRNGLGNTATASIASVTTYHSDQVGTNSVTTVSTASTQTVSKTFLDPFGEKKSSTGTEPRYLFTDQERDAESGLDYFGARFYDPWAGRFIEQDPELVGPGSGPGAVFDAIHDDGQYGNAYSYALNRPTAMIDPTGRVPYWALGATVAFAGAMQSPSDSKSDSGDAAGSQATGSSSSNDSGSDESSSDDSSGGYQTTEYEGDTTTVTWHDDGAAATSSIEEIEAQGVQYASFIDGPNASTFGVEPTSAVLPVIPGSAVAASSRALGAALEAAGVGRPAGTAAHHIVAGGAKAAAAARLVLQRLGIGINSAHNGVFLPGRAGSALAPAAVHAGGHSNVYYRAVNQALSGATTRQEAIQILNGIAEALKAGTFPW